MRKHTHTGVGHTDKKSAQHFDSEKLTNVLMLLMGIEPPVFGPTLYQLSHPSTIVLAGGKKNHENAGVVTKC